jgi:uncharacterized protein YegL
MVIVTMIVGAGALKAQEPDTAPVTILSVDDSAFPNVTAILSAEQRGVPIMDLALRDLTVQETGVAALPIGIKSAVDSDLPLALAIVLDISGSMQEGDTLGKAKAAATSLVANLRPSDQVSVIAFADEVRIVQPLTSDRSAATAAIAGLRVAGATALYDAVVQASKVAAGSSAARRAVVLLSDGEESGEPHRYGRADSLAAADTPFYVIGVGTDVDEAYLKQLARRSGGRYFSAIGPTDVPNVYADLEAFLRSQTVLTLRSNAPAQTRERSLSVSFTRGTANGTATLAYLTRRPAGASSETAPPWAALALGSVLVCCAATLVIRKKRRPADIGGPLNGDGAIRAPGLAAPVEHHTAQLTLLRGQGSAINGSATPREVFAVKDSPSVIGFGDACQIRLARAPGIAREHARVWVRDGRFMVHHIAPGYTTEVGGKPVGWASLDVGEEIRIGPYALRHSGFSDAALITPAAPTGRSRVDRLPEEAAASRDWPA